jgi:2'-5' RNA ligase
MNGVVYAVIAYVRSPVGIFVEELRRELHPAHTHADAHITILPPRPLNGTENQATELIRRISSEAAPFEVTMGDVETFIPATPTVFLRVAHGAYRLRELHDAANREALAYNEPYPYMPHLTIAKLDTEEEAMKVVNIARPRWKGYGETKQVRIDHLVLVKGTGERWIDLATSPFGGR